MQSTRKLFGLIFGVLLVLTAGLQAQEQQTATSQHPSKGQAMSRTWQFIARFEQERQDVTALARKALDLSGEQNEQLKKLSREQEGKKAELLRQLRANYAEKVRKVLNEDQKQRYDAVLGGLDALAAEGTAARDELLEEVGGDADRFAQFPAARIPLSDAAIFLDISEEKHAKFARLRSRMNRSVHQALRELPDRATLRKPEAWSEYRKAQRELHQKAQQELEARQREILSPEELEQLQKVEAAIEQYRERLRKARREAYTKIRAALQPGEGD